MREKLEDTGNISNGGRNRRSEHNVVSNRRLPTRDTDISGYGRLRSVAILMNHPGIAHSVRWVEEKSIIWRVSFEKRSLTQKQKRDDYLAFADRD